MAKLSLNRETVTQWDVLTTSNIMWISDKSAMHEGKSKTCFLEN